MKHIQGRVKKKLHEEKAILIFLILIVLFGSFIRLWNLGNQSLWIDEGYTINASLSTIKHGYPLLDSGEIYGSGILTTYITAGFIKLFSFNPFDPVFTRVPSVIFGTILILVVFYLFKNLFKNQWGGIISAFILTFSYWEIAWSRQVRGYSAATLFIVLTFLFIWKLLETKKFKFFIYSAVCFFVSYLFHGVTLVFFPAYLIAIVIALYPRLFFDKNQILKFISILLGASSILFIISLFLPFYKSSCSSTIQNLFSKEIWMPLVLSLIGIIVGIFDKRDFKAISLLGYIIVSTTVGIIFYSPASQLRYMFPLYPFMIVAAVYCIFKISDFLLDFLNVNLRRYVISGVCMVLFMNHLNFIPSSTYLLERGSPQPDFSSVFKEINKTADENDLIISSYTQLHKVYLGKTGLWLKINLNGSNENVENKIINGLDYYAAAPVIYDIDDLNRIIDSYHGYIIIDSMTKGRMYGVFPFLENNDRVKRILTKQSQKSSSDIYLYKF